MTETNVPHDENISYFGNGDEAHVIYQFSLPPLLLHAVHTGQTRYLMMWAKSLEITDLPVDCTFFNFTASHDGVGLRPLEGLVPADEINELLDAMRERGGYISTRKKPDGTDSPYELNISYFDAFRHPDEQQNQFHIQKFLLSQVFTLSFKGIPAVYIHSLFATPNDHTGVERTGMTRAINRRKWDRAELESLINNRSIENGQVFHAYKRLLQIRKHQPAFHPDAAQHILNLEEGTFGLLRTSIDNRQQLLALYNFTREEMKIPLGELPKKLSTWKELISATNMRFTDDSLILPAYAACWFSKET
jgi:sucrose phosphorylase